MAQTPSPSLEELRQLGQTAFEITGNLNPLAHAIKSYLDLLEVIRAQGFAAGLAGVRECPYADGTLAASVWLAGFIAGTEQVPRRSQRPSRGPGMG